MKLGGGYLRELWRSWRVGIGMLKIHCLHTLTSQRINSNIISKMKITFDLDKDVVISLEVLYSSYERQQIQCKHRHQRKTNQNPVTALWRLSRMNETFNTRSTQKLQWRSIWSTEPWVLHRRRSKRNRSTQRSKPTDRKVENYQHKMIKQYKKQYTYGNTSLIRDKREILWQEN